MISEAKKTAVENALRITFGVSEFEDISEITQGLSPALIFKIMVKGKPYLLRIITQMNAMNAPTHWYNCMTAAAEIGIAPRVWYTSVEDRICITDFVEAKPFPLNLVRVKMPALLSRLHSLPPFPNRINYLETMDGFVQKFRDSETLPDILAAELFEKYDQIKRVYPSNDSDLVSCHNDLKPENILFDGERPWLVDWEAAFLNDRYTDLAVIANFAVTNDVEEKEYLRIYFGEDANEYQLARFYLMRQLLHFFYFTFFGLICFNANEPVDFTLPCPNFREFNNQMWLGGINLANNDARQEYARAHFGQVIYNLKQKRFADSLKILAGLKER
ncbi:hypothetical protein EWM62_12385 [Mucilaginibacter terrigena]|uniref:Aminoglycoside phosphotransferase domain-containing protein n=1 Tax=Mucilaginibacter terrigena TaxID=2492395 RepID=A0A4Q5LNG6_9SPHI|nr:phosphotransferase [Mucilaginibacter terrigena]RYU90319.1 hypothetical protein EWM62_12385 [Mucilaginibacter terrigena]